MQPSQQRRPAYLAFIEFFPRVGFFWVIKPFDSDHHVVPPRLPHALDAADVGQVGAASGEENGAVSDADDLLAPHNGLVEQLPGLPFHSSSLPREDPTGAQPGITHIFATHHWFALSHMHPFAVGRATVFP